MDSKTDKNYCHQCNMYVPKADSLDCFVCELSCRCLECIPDKKKVHQEDGTYKYLCFQCVRKRRGPKTFYELMNQNTIVG